MLALQPNHAAARNNLAYLLAERGCKKAAIAELDTGLANMSHDDPLRHHLMDTRTEILNSDLNTGDTALPCRIDLSTP